MDCQIEGVAGPSHNTHAQSAEADVARVSRQSRVSKASMGSISGGQSSSVGGQEKNRGVYCELAREGEAAVRRVRSAPQQTLVAENPHDHGGNDQREEHAKPPEAIRAHHAPPPLRDCHRRGQQALSHGESGAKSRSYLDLAGCRWPSGVSLGAQGRRTRCRYAGPNNDTRLFIHLLRPRYVRAGVGGGALNGCMI